MALQFPVGFTQDRLTPLYPSLYPEGGIYGLVIGSLSPVVLLTQIGTDVPTKPGALNSTGVAGP
jgi:hypothetical protein